MALLWSATFWCVITLVNVCVTLPYVRADVRTGDKGGDASSHQIVRRSCEGITLEYFTDIVKIIEVFPFGSHDPKVIANGLRSLITPGSSVSSWSFHYFCGLPAVLLPGVLTDAQYNSLLNMLNHKDGPYWESGVIATPSGEAVAIGHVMFGLSCGGFEREKGFGVLEKFSSLFATRPSYPLDNLFVVTLSGDLGQTTLIHNRNDPESHLLGPGGYWNSVTCPTSYILTKKNASEATEAEIKGDIDGIILGIIMPDIVGLNMPISDILLEYYGSGLGPNNIFRDQYRVRNFKLAVQDVELTEQTIAFSQTFAEFKSLDSRNIARIPATIEQLYADYLAECVDDVREKYTTDYFVETIKIVEDLTSYDIKDMAQEMLGLVPENKRATYFSPYFILNLFGKTREDGFFWKILSDLVTHDIVNVGLSKPAKRSRELGVIKDDQSNTLSIGNVLAGIVAKKSWYVNLDSVANNLYGATIAGALAVTALRQECHTKRSGMIGSTGRWSTDCPPGYTILKKERDDYKVSLAEILGAMDGYILGMQDSDLKLSELLKQYYGSGLVGNQDVNSKRRVALFSELLEKDGGKDKLKAEITDACKDLQLRTCRSFRTNKCADIAKGALDEFTKTLLQESPAATTPSMILLPQFDVLHKNYRVYPNNRRKRSTNEEIKEMIGGEASSPLITSTDALRISLILQQFGQAIPPQATGAVIGADGKTYIYDVTVMDSYLTERYGTPISATSESAIREHRGILVMDTGNGKRVGLWDGEQLHGMQSFSGTGMKLWKTQDCQWLADQGDCKFYQCLENNYIRCGDNGYAIGYGYRYCDRFSQYRDEFTEDGKTWIDNVRKCLMTELIPVVRTYRHQSSNSEATCEMIKSFAFNSHPDCYTGVEPSFCEIIKESANWAALWKVFEVSDFFGSDAMSALSQIYHTLQICRRADKAKVMENQNDLGKKWHPPQSIDADHSQKKKRSADVDCEALARDGDCMFYECFERRFPCHDEYGVSHIRDFELISCMKFKRREAMMETKGQSWLKASQICLMEGLLTLYQDASIDCAALPNMMIENREQCFLDHGFCDVLNSQADKFSVNQVLKISGFPRTTEQENIRASILDTGVTLTSYYYQQTRFLSRLVVAYAESCYEMGMRATPNLYELRQSDQCAQDDCLLKVDVTED